MQLSYLLLTSLACLASSNPIEKRHSNAWPSPIRSFFEACSKEINTIRSSPTTPQPPTCSLSSATLPSSSLPPPSQGLLPYHIAVGRGSQNYTCDTSNPSAAPVNIGALANLYNTSCLAAVNPSMLSLVPAAAVAVPVPADNKLLFPAQSIVSGHHYFTASVPTFNLHTSTANYGITFTKKVANVTAPASTDTSSNLGPDGSKAVPWLKLQVNTPDGDADSPDETDGVKEVYRVNTAGGAAPATCQGMPANFTVQYAAEYWFFA